MDSHALLQGIFPTQGSNPDLPHYRQILYQLSHQGSPINRFSIPKTTLYFKILSYSPLEEGYYLGYRKEVLNRGIQVSKDIIWEFPIGPAVKKLPAEAGA